MDEISRRRNRWADHSKENLIDQLVNDDLNQFVSQWADYKDDDADLHGHGKRVPYIGWYWRHVTFTRVGGIAIGDCHEFVGFMQNNKWDYPQRNLTPPEQENVIGLIAAAQEAAHRGGNWADIKAGVESVFVSLWDLMQTFTLDRTGFWIRGPQGLVAHAQTREQAEQLAERLASAGGFAYTLQEA